MSKIKYSLAKILEKEGWVGRVDVLNGKDTEAKFNELKIILKYHKNGDPAVASIRRVSKPGLRVYVDKDNLPRVLNNFGAAIISTSQGLMTNKEARKKGIGGEVVCEIY